MKQKLISTAITALFMLQGCGGSSTELAEETAQEELTTPEAPILDDPLSLPATMVMIDIAGGDFTMGGTTQQADAAPVNISLSAFSISETEVTNEQYVEFLNNAYQDGLISVELQNTQDPCGSYQEYMIVANEGSLHAGEIYLQLGETGGCTSGGEAEHINNKSWITFTTANTFELLDQTKADWPINWLKWFGADAFVKYYDVSLPTEAQWEYAAQGSLGYQYATADGDLSLEQANYNGDAPGVYSEEGHSVAVKSYEPNPYGLYDMSGNVWEWCSDYYDAQFYLDNATDPENTTAGTDEKRVRRGGSWNYHAATLTSYGRASDFETRGNNHFGFRIVKNINQ